MINILINRHLPEDLRDDLRTYDKKGVDALMTEVARRYPDQYPKIAKAIGDLGRKEVYRRGETFRFEDFRPVIDRKPLFDELDAEEAKVLASVQGDDARDEALSKLYGAFSDRLSKETGKAALGARNNIALTVLSGARGKEAQLRDLISSPGFYVDGRGRPVQGFVRNSFAEGLRPADYLAGTFGARSAVTDSKRAVAKGGFLSKTLSRANATNYISEQDCGTSNGIDISTDEPDIRGRVLQRKVGEWPAGTVIDRKVLKGLKEKGITEVIARSPMTCNAPYGMCSKCFGVKAEGRFPKIGEAVGTTASNALGEPMAQGALSMKHVTSASGPKTEFSGMEYINQFAESPEEFKDRSIVAEADGRVDEIRKAPQGGHYIRIGDKEHYVPIDRAITAKVGEEVEAGDAMTDGLIDPEDVVKFKGLGAGRRYYAEKLAEIAKASGAGMDKRLFETLARSAINHVRLDDPIEEGYLPDDLVSYNDYVNRRTLPAKVYTARAHQAVGKYLQVPALHHTVGTKITPKIASELSAKGFEDLHVADDEPGFAPEMVRLQQVAAVDDDWLASQGGSYLGKQLAEGIGRAQDTNIEENIHPVPRLAVGVGYADKLESTGKF